MSITIRPEREQAEHDRLIHFLQTKYKKYDVVVNPGDEQNASVKIATRPHFPDLVLNSDKKVVGVVEIETAASVNRLETLHKWVPFSRARVPFHLYVPVQGYDTALRLVELHRVKAAEIWTYRSAVEGFDLVRMHVDSAAAEKQAKAEAVASARSSKAAKPAGRAASRPARPKPVKAAAARPASRKSKASAPKAKAPARPAAKRKSASSAAARPAVRKTTSRPAAAAGRRTKSPARTAKKGTGARTRR